MRTVELFWRGLRAEAEERGWMRAVASLVLHFAEVLRDSFPDRQRMRYGDIQYDIDHNVNTTWANVKFTTRLREALIGANYQTTDPLIFAEAMDTLRTSQFSVRRSSQSTFKFEDFTFVDLGSGKGRVLLMAAEYPFRRIMGVELLPELDAVARANVALDPRIECVLSDARQFELPDEPLVVFMFNPFPPWVLRTVLQRLQRSLEHSPRRVFVVFHNAVHELAFATAPALQRLSGTHQFVIYGNLRSRTTNLE